MLLLMFQIEYRARQEALKLKELEAKQLEKQVSIYKKNLFAFASLT